ncbi:MAG: dephospho-CoA kinase [Myxococcota bacterium]
MLVIGLTGGIAAGKSTAASLLRELGAAVIDADRLGHRVYEPGTRGFDRVVEDFGRDVVAGDGTIDRRALGDKVFGKPEALKRLTDIVWPLIRELAAEEIEQLAAEDADRVIVLEAAVLLEADWDDLVHEVWVVVVEPEIAIERLVSRDGMSRDDALARIRSQLSNRERLQRSDRAIDNSATPDELRGHLRLEWERLEQRTGKS